ncbi:MAG: tetratricopeptide repeat protein [Caulobacterales bacterium]|uniref:tetratricopeptide repeat protein n=1 Tax=Glycocaulis sp. TaxID=1969725 RepID=UPI003F9F025D
MMIAALSLALALQAAPAPHGLTDAALVNVRDGQGDLWLALDGQPSALTVASGEGTLDITLVAVACAPRDIQPPEGRAVRRLAVMPGEDGSCTVRLEGQWASANAFLGEGGVMVALDGIELAGGAAGTSLRPVGAAPASAGPSPVADAPASGNTDTASTSTVAAATNDTAQARPTTLAPSAGGACDDSASRLEDTPWDLNVMSAHADCLAGSGSTTDAITLYERVLAFEPGHYGAALGLARIRAAQGDTAAAAELFRTAAQAARTDGEALAARQAADGLGDR